MTSKEIFTAIINRINNNPMNPKKFYFTFSEIIETDKSIYFRVEFGSSKNSSIIIKEYIGNGGDKKVGEERIYSNLINKIFESVYDRMDDKSFWNWQVSKFENQIKMTEQKNIVEIIDSLIELAPNSKEVQISLSKEDFEKVKKNLDLEKGQDFSWGEFNNVKPETTEGIFAVVRQGVKVFFMNR